MFANQCSRGQTVSASKHGFVLPHPEAPPGECTSGRHGERRDSRCWHAAGQTTAARGEPQISWGGEEGSDSQNAALLSASHRWKVQALGLSLRVSSMLRSGFRAQKQNMLAHSLAPGKLLLLLLRSWWLPQSCLCAGRRQQHTLSR